MAASSPSVGKNAIWLMLATTLQKVVAFFAFFIVAKVAGPKVTGDYFFAVSITSMWVTVMDLGLTPVVIRAFASSTQEGQAALEKAWQAKRFLIPLAIIGAIAYPLFTQLDRYTVLAIALACLVMSADTVSLLWYGVLRGYQRLQFEAIGMFVGQCVTAVLSIVIVLLGGGVYSLILALFAGSLWNVGWSFWQTRRLQTAAPIEHRPILTWRALGLQVLPFALAGIFVKVYSYVDTLMIRAWHGPAAVGQYAVAYKLTYALQFLPLTFVAALYPALSAAFAKKDQVQLQSTFQDAWRFMALVGFPAAAFLSGFAPRLVPFLYGTRYASAGPILAVLAWVLAPIFLDFPIGSLLNASRRAGYKTTAMGITMLVNVILNALLVPRLSGVGAAWAAVGSFSLLVIVGVGFAAPLLKDKLALSWIVGRGAVIAVILWTVIRTFTRSLSLFVALPAAGAFALLGVFLIGLLRWTDLTHLWQIVRRRSTPV